MTKRIVIQIGEQMLHLHGAHGLIRSWPVSTAINGPGELHASGCTPCGSHVVRAMIGAGCEEGTVFVARRPTGEVYSPALAALHPGRDWILTRILWLCGREPGKNRFGPVDTMRRYIYIHGCPDELGMGEPLSHGCIRMRNRDVVQLFDLVQPGCEVYIQAP